MSGTFGTGCSRICPSGKFPSGYNSQIGIDGGLVCWRRDVGGCVPFVTTPFAAWKCKFYFSKFG